MAFIPWGKMTTDITRDTVLAAVDALRAGDPNPTTEKKLDAAVRDIITSVIAADGDRIDYTAYPTPATSRPSGVLIDVSVSQVGSTRTRSLAIVALASSEETAQLDGFVLLSALPLDAVTGRRTLDNSELSGTVYVSTPVDVSDVGVLEVALTSVAFIEEAPAQSAAPPPPEPTPRSGAELRAARTAYTKALAKARTKYLKARKKAGKSKRRKAAAKKSYTQRKARAKATYRAAIADIPAVPTTSAAPVPAAAPDRPPVVISTDVGWAVAV